jgi:hypothetical protein
MPKKCVTRLHGDTSQNTIIFLGTEAQILQEFWKFKMSPNSVTASIAVYRGIGRVGVPAGLPIKTDTCFRPYACQRFDNRQPDFHEIWHHRNLH